MAQYRRPDDPRQNREGLFAKRPRRQRRDDEEPLPWLWLGMGLLVTLVGIGVMLAIINSFLTREPLAVEALPPTVIVLTAPPTAEPTATQPFATPTVLPTLTPVPTPDIFNPPDEITVGYFAVVANTGGFGVTIRGGPSTNNIRVLVANEGAYMTVFEGPVAEEGADRLWWRVRLLDGTEGWVAGDFIELAPPPE